MTFVLTVSPGLPAAQALRFIADLPVRGSVAVGSAVAWAGDTNGDRVGDFVIGAPLTDFGTRADVGAAHIVAGNFGWASIVGDVELSDAVGGPSRYRVLGSDAVGVLGAAAAGVGDFDGDGLADLIVGAPGVSTPGQAQAGTAALLFGNSPFPVTNIPPASVAPPRGSALAGGQLAGDAAGWAVAGPGDVNGDGYADILVGTPFTDPAGRANAGGALLILGGASAGLDLAAPGAQGFRIQGAAQGDRAGLALSAAGDLNADGYADFVVAAPFATPFGRTAAGSAYVVFGRPGGWADLDLGTPGAWGFRVDGATAGDGLGTAVAAAGDVNGDGFGDLLLGAAGVIGAGLPGLPAGAAYLLFGGPQFGGPQFGGPLFGGSGSGANIDLAVGAAGSWVVLRGGIDTDGEGNLTSADGIGGALSAGDVNGDGFSDIALGATGFAGGDGAVFIVHGRTGPWADIADLGALTPAQGFQVNGRVGAGSGFGAAVALNGDGNGDGFADLLVGAPFARVTPASPAPGAPVIAGEAWLLSSQATGPARLRGTSLADSLGGGAGDDTLDGFGQDDLLVGRGGNDSLIGGAGDDTLLGEAGHDWLSGGPGTNSLGGGAGADTASYAWSDQGVTVNLSTGTASGGAGLVSDLLTEIENLIGGAGDDTLIGNAAANTLDGGGGGDSLRGGDGPDLLLGGGGGDSLAGEHGNDTLRGGEGDDWLAGGQGTNTLDGDAGNDTLSYEWSAFGVSANLATGIATVPTGPLQASDRLSGVENLTGTAVDDMLRGDAGANRLAGLAGNDTVDGGGGDDWLSGGFGFNTLIGGDGEDTASYGFMTEAVTASLGAGSAIGGGGAAFVLDSLLLIEHLTGGAAGDILGGNTLANRLLGGAGADLLFGEGGADELHGEAGEDVLYGGAGSDALHGGADADSYDVRDLGDQVFELATDAGTDRAFVSVSFWQAGDGIEQIYLINGGFAVTGGQTGESITANATGASTLDGGGGDDELFGSVFADLLIGGVGNDVLRGNGGGDRLRGGAGADQMVSSAGVADRFEFAAPGWAPNPASLAAGARVADEIFGFERGLDRLDFQGSGVISLAGFVAIREIDGNTQIEAADGGLINLYGVTGLNASDFVF